jgi:hypothetical protein
MITGIEKKIKNEKSPKVAQNLRKSVYQDLMIEKNPIIEETESMTHSQNLLRNSNFLNVGKSKEGMGFGEITPNPNQMVRKSILSKNLNKNIKLKNSISCMELPNNKLIPQDEVDQDVSNLKKLKKKLAIIEEKEKKQLEKTTIKRKARLKKKINQAPKTVNESQTHTTTKSREIGSKENEKAFESKDTSKTNELSKPIEKDQQEKMDLLGFGSEETNPQGDDNFRILSNFLILRRRDPMRVH